MTWVVVVGGATPIINNDDCEGGMGGNKLDTGAKLGNIGGCDVVVVVVGGGGGVALG